jgi:hypothetical protein
MHPCTALDRPWGFHGDKASRFHDSRHMRLARLSAVRTGCLYPPPPPGNNTGTHLPEAESPLGHVSAAGKIMTMKNSSDTFEDQNHDQLACSELPQTLRHGVTPFV